MFLFSEFLNILLLVFFFCCWLTDNCGEKMKEACTAAVWSKQATTQLYGSVLSSCYELSEKRKVLDTNLAGSTAVSGNCTKGGSQPWFLQRGSEIAVLSGKLSEAVWLV